MRWISLSLILPVVAVLGADTAYEYDASDFAISVESYVAGVGATYVDPASALGRPTVDTRGDGVTGSPLDPVVVLPVYPAYRTEELVSIGDGGHLTLSFDHPVEDDPRNPCGIDLIVFGNALQDFGGGQFWLNGDPNLTTVQLASIGSEPGVVSVSQDGTQWHTFDNSQAVPPKPTPLADSYMPTLGRVYDPDNPEPSLPGNAWWGVPTNPTRPINPLWTGADFVGWTVADYARRYGCAAGGTGFDLKDVGLAWILYVRVENDDGDELTPEIDAVADAAPYLFPDFDCDNDVDDDDLDHFRSCATGPALGPPEGDCARADFDADGDVDQSDFARVQRCFSGMNVPVNPACVEP